MTMGPHIHRITPPPFTHLARPLLPRLAARGVRIPPRGTLGLAPCVFYCVCGLVGWLRRGWSGGWVYIHGKVHIYIHLRIFIYILYYTQNINIYIYYIIHTHKYAPAVPPTAEGVGSGWAVR